LPKITEPLLFSKRPHQEVGSGYGNERSAMAALFGLAKTA